MLKLVRWIEDHPRTLKVVLIAIAVSNGVTAYVAQPPSDWVSGRSDGCSIVPGSGVELSLSITNATKPSTFRAASGGNCCRQNNWP
jgi:hypothetical protein